VIISVYVNGDRKEILMYIWFIKNEFKDEFDNRLSEENNNCESVAETMCQEGKGISLLKEYPNKSGYLYKKIFKIKASGEYFDVMIDLEELR
jgi:hypothetical protein